MWVSPFRYLRIVRYLPLPAAFRSLSRLSSALSAKASALCLFCLASLICIALQTGPFSCLLSRIFRCLIVDFSSIIFCCVNFSRYSYGHFACAIILNHSGSHLLSHAVSSIVPSAAQTLTIVFGMGTGVSPGRIATGGFGHLLGFSPFFQAPLPSRPCFLQRLLATKQQNGLYLISLERR